MLAYLSGVMKLPFAKPTYVAAAIPILKSDPCLLWLWYLLLPDEVATATTRVASVMPHAQDPERAVECPV